ncbi:MAG: hypothetical protein GY696_19780, partial [Gammaproteobacteria bacterium]|nr:hypothetical protein [Gammaproteobacteria bacterium]
MAGDFTAYQLTWQIEEATRQSSNRMCQQQQHPLQSGPLAIQPGVFAMVHGNLYYRFACENKTAVNAEVSE